MSRDKEYQRLLNSKRWSELRAWKMQQSPLCELCLAGNFVRSSVDIHHIVPVESAKSRDEMERLCFDPSNLQALCIPCHIRVHQEARSHTKAKVQENKKKGLERWIARHAASSDLATCQLLPDQGSATTCPDGMEQDPEPT